MSFYEQGFVRVTASANSNAGTIWQYQSLNNADNKAAILTSAYFNAIASLLNINDRIYCIASDDNFFADVTATTPNVTLAEVGDIPTGSIVNAMISPTAAIAFSKLAPLSNGQILVGSASNVVTAVTPSGQITVSNTGELLLGTGVVGDLQVGTNAAIQLSKLQVVTAGSIVMGNASNVAAVTPVTGAISITNAGVTALTAGAVTLNSLATGVKPFAMVIAKGSYSYSGGSATIVIPVVGILATDLAICQFQVQSSSASVKTSLTSSGTITTTASADPGSSTITYVVYRDCA